MNSNIDRVSEQQSKVINLNIGVRSITSDMEIMMSNKPINIEIKIARNLSVNNVPLQVIAKDNVIRRELDGSITE